MWYAMPNKQNIALTTKDIVFGGFFREWMVFLYTSVIPQEIKLKSL